MNVDQPWVFSTDQNHNGNYSEYELNIQIIKLRAYPPNIWKAKLDVSRLIGTLFRFWVTQQILEKTEKNPNSSMRIFVRY